MIELEDAPDKQVNEDLSNKKFTNWKNEPTLENLKENYTLTAKDPKQQGLMDLQSGGLQFGRLQFEGLQLGRLQI